MPRKSKIVIEPELIADKLTNLITDMDGLKVVKSDKFPELIMELFGGEEVDMNKFKADEYGNQPIMIVNEKLYKMNIDKYKKEGAGLNRKSDDSLAKMTNEEKEIYLREVKANAKAHQKVYREQNRQKYNDYQRRLYHKLKTEGSKVKPVGEEWKEERNVKAREANKKYREKKKAEKIARGEEIKPRGRPSGYTPPYKTKK
jgi:hypothetical protein